MKLKKQLTGLSVTAALLLSACSTAGTASKGVFTGVEAADKQFAQVLYTKDIGQKEFTQYLQSIGGVTTQEKQDAAEKKYLEINQKALTSLKQLKINSADNKNYVAALVNLAELSDKINKVKVSYVKEYQNQGKLSEKSQKQSQALQAQIQKAYQSAMEQEIALTEKYAAAAAGEFKDFLATQALLNRELVEVSRLQEQLYQDSAVKTEEQFNNKAKPQLAKINAAVLTGLNAVKAGDEQVRQYIAKLSEYYRTKAAMINKGQQIAAEQKKGKLSAANAALINQYTRLEEETNQLRLDLLKRFGS